MKILAIRLKNLASLAGPFEIDFTAEPLASAGLFAITGLESHPELQYAPFTPVIPKLLQNSENIFSVVSKQDILLLHPFESFTPVVDLLRQAGVSQRMDAEGLVHAGFELALDSSASQQDIDNVFEFVLDRSGIRVFPPGTPAETFLRLIDHAAASEPHLPELLLACGALTAQQWQQAQAAPPASLVVIPRRRVKVRR